MKHLEDLFGVPNSHCPAIVCGVVFTVPASQRSSVHMHLVSRSVRTTRCVESLQCLEVHDVGSGVSANQVDCYPLDFDSLVFGACIMFVVTVTFKFRR